jgi:hypothetical protein
VIGGPPIAIDPVDPHIIYVTDSAAMSILNAWG